MQPISDFNEEPKALFIQHKDLSSLQSALALECYVCYPFFIQLNAEEREDLWRQKPQDCMTFMFLQKDDLLGLKDSFLMGIHSIRV